MFFLERYSGLIPKSFLSGEQTHWLSGVSFLIDSTNKTAGSNLGRTEMPRARNKLSL